MTRKHDTLNAPSTKNLAASVRLAYYQAHHDSRFQARQSYALIGKLAGRAYVTAYYVSFRPSISIKTLVISIDPIGNSVKSVALRIEIASVLLRIADVLRRPNQGNKISARAALARARDLRLMLADHEPSFPHLAPRLGINAPALHSGDKNL